MHAVEDYMRRGCDARFADGKGWTAVHYAAEYDHPQVILLVQRLAVEMASERRRVLQAANSKLVVQVQPLPSKGKTVLRSGGSSEAAPEVVSAPEGNLSAEDVQALVDIDSPDKHGWTPLATACSAGHVRVVQQIGRASCRERVCFLV